MVINETPCSLEMSTLNAGGAPATRTLGTTAEGTTSSHPPLQRVASSAPPQCGDGRPAETVSAVIVTFDDSYLKTLPGIVRMVQVVCSLICLVFLVSSGHNDEDYLLLPVAGRLRLLVFACIVGFLLSILMTALRVTKTIHMLPINWNLFDLIVYSFVSGLFLVSSSLAANAIWVQQNVKGQPLPQWTSQQLIGSIVFGYVCTLVFAITAGLGFRQRFYKVRQRIQKFQLSQQSSNSTFVEQLEP